MAKMTSSGKAPDIANPRAKRRALAFVMASGSATDCSHLNIAFAESLEANTRGADPLRFILMCRPNVNN